MLTFISSESSFGAMTPPTPRYDEHGYTSAGSLISLNESVMVTITTDTDVSCTVRFRREHRGR